MSNPNMDGLDIDAILEDMDSITRPLLIQLILLSLPVVLASFHTAAMVFLGFSQGHICTTPRKTQIIQECNITWSEQQTHRYIPWDNQTNNLDGCSRYKYDRVNCTVWTDDYNDTIALANNSNNTERCDSWIFDQSVIRTTVVADFDLVCDDKQKGRLSQAIFMLGITLGVATLGQLSDRYGRKLTALLPMIVGGIFSIATAFSESFVVFTVLRFFIGFTLLPSATSCYVAATEMVNRNQKVWFCQFFELIFGVGICMLSVIAYFIRDWRRLQLWISAPSVLLVIALCFMYESPRWLVSKQKFSHANDVIRKLMTERKYRQSDAARKLESLSSRPVAAIEMVLYNPIRFLITCLHHRPQQDSFTKEEMVNLNGEDKPEVEISNRNIHNDTIIDILRLRNMRKKSLIFFYLWTVTSALYYGLTLNAAELGGNVYLNLFLSAVVDVPASILAVPMIKNWGRRPTLTLTLILSGVVCICMMFVSKEIIWLNVTLSTIGKFSISAAFGTVYIFSIDIYPTPVRNAGLGVCSSWARIGGTLAPFISMLDVLGFAVPYVTFGLLAVIGGFLGLLLPETRGKKIPETLQEAEEFGNDYDGIMAAICSKM